MSRIRSALTARNLTLPPPLEAPDGVHLPFSWVNVRGSRVLVSGHGPQGPDGKLAGPFGQLGADVTVEEGKALAQLVALSMLSSLERALGDLDRITGWARVHGLVNSTPGFDRQPIVVNGFSELVVDLFGPEIGRHARSAIGVAALPFNMAVEIEAEVLIG